MNDVKMIQCNKQWYFVDRSTNLTTLYEDDLEFLPRPFPRRSPAA